MTLEEDMLDNVTKGLGVLYDGYRSFQECVDEGLISVDHCENGYVDYNLTEKGVQRLREFERKRGGRLMRPLKEVEYALGRLTDRQIQILQVCSDRDGIVNPCNEDENELSLMVIKGVAYRQQFKESSAKGSRHVTRYGLTVIGSDICTLDREHGQLDRGSAGAARAGCPA